MNIFELIRSDHAALRELLNGISGTNANSPERGHLFARLLEAMQIHALAEEQSLYTTLLSWPALTEECRHYVIEHAEVDELLHELEREDMSHPCWKIRFYRLRHVLEQHMEEEELQMLPKVERLVSHTQAEYLSDIYRTRKCGYRQVA
jgi:hemerythrin superfamily protein